MLDVYSGRKGTSISLSLQDVLEFGPCDSLSLETVTMNALPPKMHEPLLPQSGVSLPTLVPGLALVTRLADRMRQKGHAEASRLGNKQPCSFCRGLLESFFGGIISML